MNGEHFISGTVKSVRSTQARTCTAAFGGQSASLAPDRQ
jgi:hypothetical protein